MAAKRKARQARSPRFLSAKRRILFGAAIAKRHTNAINLTACAIGRPRDQLA